MRRKILTFIAVMFCAVNVIMIVLPPEVNAGTYIIFSEDFEGVFPGTQWNVSDENSEYGLDYWGVSSYRYHTGSKSVWCAQVGINHNNGELNSVNHYYDESMVAQMEIYIDDISGYESATLSFYYWAITGSFSLADYISVWVWSGDTWVEKWDQPSVNSNGWQNVNINIPTTASYLLFLFFSEDTVGWGPYEGVYIDDVVITGIDVTKPTITIINPSTDSIVTSSDVSISWVGSDVTSGIERYEVKLDNGSWTNIGDLNSTTLNNVGDGSHSVTVRAYDKAGNYDDTSVTFTVNTDPFSMSGPYKGLPLFLLILVVIIIAVLALWIVLRKKIRFE